MTIVMICPDIVIAGMGYWPTHCVLVLRGQTAPGRYYLQYTSKCLCMGVYIIYYKG